MCYPRIFLITEVMARLSLAVFLMLISSAVPTDSAPIPDSYFKDQVQPGYFYEIIKPFPYLNWLAEYLTPHSENFNSQTAKERPPPGFELINKILEITLTLPNYINQKEITKNQCEKDINWYINLTVALGSLNVALLAITGALLYKIYQLHRNKNLDTDFDDGMNLDDLKEDEKEKEMKMKEMKINYSNNYNQEDTSLKEYPFSVQKTAKISKELKPKRTKSKIPVFKNVPEDTPLPIYYKSFHCIKVPSLETILEVDEENLSDSSDGESSMDIGQELPPKEKQEPNLASNKMDSPFKPLFENDVKPHKENDEQLSLVKNEKIEPTDNYVSETSKEDLQDTKIVKTDWKTTKENIQRKNTRSKIPSLQGCSLVPDITPETPLKKFERIELCNNNMKPDTENSKESPKNIICQMKDYLEIFDRFIHDESAEAETNLEMELSRKGAKYSEALDYNVSDQIESPRKYLQCSDDIKTDKTGGKDPKKTTTRKTISKTPNKILRGCFLVSDKANPPETRLNKSRELIRPTKDYPGIINHFNADHSSEGELNSNSKLAKDSVEYSAALVTDDSHQTESTRKSSTLQTTTEKQTEIYARPSVEESQIMEKTVDDMQMPIFYKRIRYCSKVPLLETIVEVEEDNFPDHELYSDTDSSMLSYEMELTQNTYKKICESLKQQSENEKMDHKANDVSITSKQRFYESKIPKPGGKITFYKRKNSKDPKESIPKKIKDKTPSKIPGLHGYPSVSNLTPPR